MKNVIDVYFFDSETTVSFSGYMNRKKFMERIAYLKDHGFRFRKSDNTWTKPGDHAEKTKLELDHLDEINAAKKAAPKKVTAPELVNTAAYEDAWHNIIEALDVLGNIGLDRERLIDAVEILENAGRKFFQKTA